MGIFELQTSTSAGYNLSTDLSRLAQLWKVQYRIARRDEDPLAALVVATLSTAEAWRWLR